MQILSEQTVAETRDELATVRKAVLDLGREHVVGIMLTIYSGSEVPVELQVVEEFPGHVSMADIQIHPAYNPEKWSIIKEDHRMVFETELPPWSTVETVYGVRASQDDLDSFIGEPRIAVSRAVTDEPTDRAGGEDEPATASDAPAPEPAENPAPEATDDLESADAEQGDANGQPDSDTEPAVPDSGETNPATADSRTTDRSSAEPFVYGEDRSRQESTPRPEGQGAEGEPGRARDPAANEASAETPDDIESLVAAVAKGDLTDAERATLRAGLGLEPTREEPSQRPEFRQAAASLSSIADALDQLTEERRSSPEEFDSLARGLDRVARDVDELETAVQQAVNERAALHDRIDALERQLPQANEVASTVKQLDARIGELEALFDADEAAAIGEVIAAERAWRQQHDAVGLR